VTEFCPEGTPGCQTQNSASEYYGNSGVVGSESELAMKTAGDKKVPLGEAALQQPRWFGDAFMK